jgi:hypothetical protein
MRRVVLAVLAISIALCAAATSAQEIPSESWMGVYFGQTKIGYTEFRIDRASFEGRMLYRLRSTMFDRMTVMGVKVEQDVDTTIYLDDKYAPVYQTFKMSSGGSSTNVTARFQATQILAEMESQGSKISKAIPIPEGSVVMGDSTFLTNTGSMKIGDKIDVKTFDPLSLTLDDMRMELLRKEDIAIGGETVPSFVIKSTTPMGDVTVWQDSKGNLLKAIGLMGITMIREPKEAAKSLPSDVPGYTPPSDLAVMSSAATNIRIPDPRQVSHLKIRLAGLADRSLVIEDDRQKVQTTEEHGHLTAEYEIDASEFDCSKSVDLPITDPDLKKYLEDGPYIQPSNSEIAETAKSSVGMVKNACDAASNLRRWVYGNMEPKGEKGIVRTSVDVLHTKSGVCRDYAILYTALARSVGIPTKLVAGLVYWNGGLYYHAWAESYVGKWIAIDPTLPTDFVDATHIKLVEGDADSMYSMLKTVGSIKATIVEYKER